MAVVESGHPVHRVARFLPSVVDEVWMPCGFSVVHSTLVAARLHHAFFDAFGELGLCVPDFALGVCDVHMSHDVAHFGFLLAVWTPRGEALVLCVDGFSIA